VVKTIIILQTPALILINLQLFGLAPSGLLGSRMAHLGKEEFGLAVRHQRLSSLSLPLSSPRLTELMQLIPVPSVTSTATEYMFLTV
jgi:hypothetical protein